jgi:replicative DNA helicase
MKIETWETEEIEYMFIGFLAEAFESGSHSRPWVHELLASVDAEWFSDENRKSIYRSMCDIAIESSGVKLLPQNAIAIKAETDTGEKSGWAHSLIEVAKNNVTHFDHRSILDSVIPLWRIKRARKRMLDINRRVTDALDSTPTERTISQDIPRLLEAQQEVWGQAITSSSQVDGDWVQTIEEILQPLPAEDSVPIGIRVLDENIGGGVAGPGSADNGRLIIIAARPGAGKTTAAITIGTQLASRGHGVVFFSLEMGAKQIQCKSIACLDFLKLHEQGALINPLRVSNIKNRSYTKEQIERIKAIDAGELNKKFKVLEGNHSVASICATVKTLCRTRNDMRAIIIDYLQLIPDCKEGSLNEASAIGEVTRALKLAARSAKIDIILLSQVNRGVEQRTEKIPGLADLRASGRIEEDADIVMFLYRPFYYSTEADPGELTISLAKNRNGITGLLDCRVDLASSVIFG